VLRAWICVPEGTREVSPEEAMAAVTAGTAHAWIDIEGGDGADATDAHTVASVLAPLQIHPLVLEDMVMEINRPKVDDYGRYLYVVVHSARWDGPRPSLQELDIVVGDRFLLTYHEGPTRSVSAAREVLARRPDLLSPRPARLLHFLLDVLVDNYLPLVDHVADEIDGLEDQVFAKPDTALHERVVRLKRGMSALRRIVGPQRDTVLALTRDEFAAIPAELRPYLRDVYDRLARVSDLLDSFRDEAGTLLDLHVAVNSNRLNEVIKRLTVIATIGLPLTVITSYYGMNFAFPEYQWPNSPLYALGLLVVTAAVTWALLRWRRWL
jgi:magnesium transporter